MKKEKDDDIFEEHEDDITDDSVTELDTSLFLEEEDLPTDTDEFDDPEELERRRVAYLELKKTDKIFNNSYTMGHVTGDEIEEPRQHTEIRIDPGSQDYRLYDREQHSDLVDDSITQIDIHEFVSTSTEVKNILGDNPDKKKFDKIEVNDLFSIIRLGVSNGKHASSFVNSIHVLDSISSLTGLEYKKLFDMLTYENKEILLLELDKKYHILDKSSKEFRIYE